MKFRPSSRTRSLGVLGALALILTVLAPLMTAAPASAAGPQVITVALSTDRIAANGPASSNPNAARATATATVVDNDGAVRGASVTWGTSGDMTFFPAASCTTDTNGQCSVFVQASGTADDETITGTATASGSADTATLHEYLAATTVTLSPSTQEIVADGTTRTAISAHVTGTGSQPSNGAPVKFTTDGDMTFPNHSSDTATDTCITDDAGNCSVDMQASTTADTETITGKVDSASGTAQIIEDPPAVGGLALTLTPAAISANNVATTTASVTLTATGGGPVSGAVITFTASDPNDVFVPPTKTCTTNGAGTCSVTIKASNTPGKVLVSATTPGASASKVLDQYGAVASVTLSPPTQTVSANGVSTATLTATVTDAGGDFVGGATVQFGIVAPGDMTFQGGTTCTTGTDDATKGTCTKTLLSSTTPGENTITATNSGKTGSAKIVEAGPPAIIGLTLGAAALPADGAHQTTATVRVADANSVPIPGQNVVFTNPGGDLKFSSTSCQTASDGTCQITITTSKTADTETVTATSGTLTKSDSLVETAPNKLALFVSPASVEANGTDTASATVVITDVNGAGFSGLPVSFTTNGDVTFSSSGACTTNTSGTCAVNITASKTADNETITATSGSLSGSKPLTETARNGYWLVGRRGTVYGFGEARSLGDAPLGPADAVDIESTPDGSGYWILDSAGHVFGFNAPFLGNIALQPNEVATAMSAQPNGGGYWIFTNRGRAAAFGTAQFFGDMAGRPLNGPVIGSVATPSGKGYYMVATDGGIFSFGDAAFHGSMGGKPLNKPVVGLVPDPDGFGYWLDASDGGVFSFDAPFRGSMGGRPLNKPVIGMVAYGNGYLMVASDGGVFDFSDKPFSGSLGSNPPSIPIVNIAALGR